MRMRVEAWKAARRMTGRNEEVMRDILERSRGEEKGGEGVRRKKG